jgi:putative transposase
MSFSAMSVFLTHSHMVTHGVDVGLEKFLATSDGVLVKPPKFF